MDFKVKILKDSINIVGNRLTTFELTYPRFIHSELLTHRMFSRNSASSRAIPVEKMLANIVNHPVLPRHYGKNQAGMQAYSVMSESEQADAEAIILRMRNACVAGVEELMAMGAHKQLANRYIEPWMWITVIMSTTNTRHFDGLRNHEAAEPHFQILAKMMDAAREESEPTLLFPGEWHLPLTGFEGDEKLSQDDLVKVSTARCARVSYLTHEGKRDVEKDIKLHDDLSGNGHWSPFEHPAQALLSADRSGNFVGFKQYRKFFPSEYVRETGET